MSNLIQFRETAIEINKQRCKMMLENCSDFYTKRMIEALQASITKAEEGFDRQVENAEKRKKFDDTYERYLRTAQNNYQTVTEFAQKQIAELREKLNIQ
jgi:hypothetical protein